MIHSAPRLDRPSLVHQSALRYRIERILGLLFKLHADYQGKQATLLPPEQLDEEPQEPPGTLSQV